MRTVALVLLLLAGCREEGPPAPPRGASTTGAKARAAPTAEQPFIVDLAWSLDDRAIATYGAQGWCEGVVVWSLPDLHPRVLRDPPGSEPSASPRFAAGGTRIATSVWAGARLWDATTGELLTDLRFYGAEMTFSPDGTSALAVSPGYGALLVDADSGALRWRLDVENHTTRTHEQLAWSPDSRYALTTAYERLLRWDASGASPTVLSGAYLSDIAAGTRWIAAQFPDGAIEVWDVSGARERRTLLAAAIPGTKSRANDMDSSLALNADGRRLAALGSDQRVHVWDLDRAGREVRVHHEPKGEALPKSIEFSPDGKYLLLVELRPEDKHFVADVLLWSTERLDQAPRRLDLEDDGSYFEIEWITARTFAVTGAGSEQQLWDAQLGKRLRRWPDGPGRVRYSHDGRFRAEVHRGVKLERLADGATVTLDASLDGQLMALGADGKPMALDSFFAGR